MADENEMEGPDELEADPSEQQGGGVSADAGAFMAKFSDLPSVVAAKQMLAERGYPADDPIMMMFEALSLYDRRSEILTSRQIEMIGGVVKHMETLRTEMQANRTMHEGLVNVLEDVQDLGQTMGQQFGAVIRSNADYVPFLERVGREIRGAAELIENRSTKAVILSYLAPAITLVTGFIAGLLYHRM